MQSNTIFITGGGSGIGRGLAEAFHKLGNQIIIAGRREEPLKKTCAANPGMSYVLMDVADAASVRSGAAQVTSRFPELNCLINNAGIQRMNDFTHSEAVNDQVVRQEIEIVPPYVATDLGQSHRPAAGGPAPMPLDEFIAALMQELAEGPDEAAVGTAKRLVAASSGEAVRSIFAGMNP